MSKKENANQKLSKWMNHTYIETEEKKPFFEGYRPNYYFNKESEDLSESQISESQIQDLIYKAIFAGKDKFENYTSTSSKGFTLDDMYKAMEQLEKLPPVPIEIEIGRIAWEILISKLKIYVVHDSSKFGTLFGINIVLYEGDDIKINQMKVKYNNGDSKVVDVFEYNCNFDIIYKNVFEEDK